MNQNKILDKLLQTLPSVWELHSPRLPLYALLKSVARAEVERLFADGGKEIKKIEPFGEIYFPYHNMGAVDSLNLFDLDELIIFSYYWLNRKRYRKSLDIGANIGLHSVIQSKCGFDVRCFEPDPKHFEILKKNIEANRATSVHSFNMAVSDKSGELEFVRVLGNTTGSHLAGSKVNPYGQLDRFPVKVEAIGPLLDWADFVKLDAEGHEKEIILSTSEKNWKGKDAFIEIENENNARLVFEHFQSIGMNMFSQKNNWQLVLSAKDMPTSYHDGSLFVSSENKMNWS